MKLPYRVNRLISRYFILFCLVFSLFSETWAQTYFNDMEDTAIPVYWIGQQSIDSGQAFSGIHSSVTDSLSPYGFGMEMPFPEEKRGSNTFVNISAWVKSHELSPNAAFVITVTEEGQELFWERISLDTVIKKANTWYKFTGAFTFPASVTREAVFKCFLWNIDQKTTVAIDDLQIRFELLETPTFLPPNELLTEYIKPKAGIDKILFSNHFYLIGLDGLAISFLSKDYEPIALFPFALEHFVVGGDEVMQITQFSYQGSKTRKGKTSLKFVARNKYTTKKLLIHCDENSPELSFEISEKYKKKVACKRSALLFKGIQPIKEVMRASRKSDINEFQNEYWLDKQGLVFGTDNNSLIIYHTPGISSLQLDTENNNLWVNLDFEMDHSFLHFPLRDDTVDYKLDWSESIYKRRNRRENFFNVYMGTKTSTLPRMMKNPSGYLATYIWTEHADYSNIRTNRATYFGSEKIHVPENAIGGFIYYDIPVTKSVFYNNPDKITNESVSGGRFTGLESTILTDSSFQGFLNQIKAYGNEICLHTPEQYTTTADQLKAALGFMKQNYGSKTWIDHGYNNLIHNNREDFMCDGLLKNSPYYAAKLWKEFGVSYFWNAFYEDYFTFEKWRFGSSIEPYFIGFGDFMPKPDYWKHPTRSAEFIHWPTSTVLYIDNNDLWYYFFNERNLEAFVNSWSVDMNHCYPAWVDPKKGFWTYDSDSTIVAQPGFNATLEKMSTLKKEGQLNVTTVEEFLDYQLLMENVGYQVLSDCRVRITNNNAQDIKGLSFATKAKAVLVDRLKPVQKTSGEDLVFWFDLEAERSCIIRFVE